MNLTHEDGRERLRQHDHGVLCTVHPTRGTDVVPVVFAIANDFLGIPIDEVKPKASSRLQRERNLEADPRATLLVEHWNSTDWSKLWWVRAELEWISSPSTESVSEVTNALATKYAQYRNKPFSRVLVFQVKGIIGWSGSE